MLTLYEIGTHDFTTAEALRHLVWIDQSMHCIGERALSSIGEFLQTQRFPRQLSQLNKTTSYFCVENSREYKRGAIPYEIGTHDFNDSSRSATTPRKEMPISHSVLLLARSSCMSHRWVGPPFSAMPQQIYNNRSTCFKYNITEAHSGSKGQASSGTARAPPGLSSPFSTY
eukprot:4096659-Ditylum_brightwellii.AAC.1